MEIRFNVMVNNKQIGLQDAFNQGYIMFEQNGIKAASNVLLKLSTQVYDRYDQEIFFEDKLYDDNNTLYIVKYLYGTSYLYKFSHGKFSLYSTLSSLQFKNKIDLIKKS